MTIGFKHLDEARHAAEAALIASLSNAPRDCRMVMIEDLYGQIRLVLWPGSAPEGLIDDLRAQMAQQAQGVWSDDIWTVGKDVPEADRFVYEDTWKESQPHPADARLRILNRYRSRGAWLHPTGAPLWKKPVSLKTKHPPIVVFYSFKGGVGRSTALAAFAIQRARRGERVAVIDADLDAPGIGTLLAADEQGTTSNWGVADYLLEKPLGPVDLRDYYHACRREPLTGKGEILVVPSGRIDGDYLGKLARLDFEPPSTKDKHPFFMLLEDVRTQLHPHWIFVDLRAGLAENAGLILGGFAHLHVLFGTASEQSWQGLRLIIERLGADRIRANHPDGQGDCVMVQAMVPENTEVYDRSTQRFGDRARDEFAEFYYAEAGADSFWTIEDLESSDAPHVPVPIRYNVALADFRNLDEVAGEIAESKNYQELTARIVNRFGGDGK